ncbi:hypothetical protein C8F01DRAFT_1228962 [Mycena amicta]|nr:hypothetical protein C8F01DRAFT_1228962 [Mycena amicta]
MFSKLTILAAMAVSAASLANAYNGTAALGFYNVVNCACPPWNGPYAIAIPSSLIGDKTCCNDQVSLSYLDQTTTAVFSGYYDAGEGAQDVALSPLAFGALSGHPWETALENTVWEFL